MKNEVTNWSTEMPTEEGLYLVCYGDVESPASVGMFFHLGGYFYPKDGFLLTRDRAPVEEYVGRYKFAKLEF